MAAMLVVMSAPAMANHNDNDFDDGVVFFGNDINDFFGFGHDNDIDDFFGFDNFFGNDGFFGPNIDQESESGDVSIGFDVSNTGRYASQCTPATQFGNTGNFQNGSTFVQGPGSELDDFEPEGIDVSFGGSQDVSCPSTIQQSSAASS